MTNSLLQEIVCCMGQPVAGNPTQYMMEKAFSAAHLDWRYLTLEVAPANLPHAVRGIRALGFKGANFTIPHKVAVVPLLDSLSEAADLIGAVNCVTRDDDRLSGENTDGKGFVESLRPLLDPAGKKVVILGAGGAARAIAVELGLAGAAEVVIVNRNAQRGQDLVRVLAEKVRIAARYDSWEGMYRIPAEAELVINATSVGLGDADALPEANLEAVSSQAVVADVVFNPPQTRFLDAAAERGCRTLDGLGMLVNQAAINFRLWTAVDPDRGVMREALEEFLEL